MLPQAIGQAAAAAVVLVATTPRCSAANPPAPDWQPAEAETGLLPNKD